ESDLKTYFQKYAHQEGLVFEAGVFDELLIKSNYDFSDTLTNIAFLKSYKTDGHISSNDVREAIPKSLQDNIFDLTQDVLLGRIDLARDLVRDLRLQG
ncbi:DNA polymerase III subunit delta, partial [Streptococcus sp. SPC0]|nr:DNA polymerase III subunit delta [Streptococcus sp. SPC0]